MLRLHSTITGTLALVISALAIAPKNLAQVVAPITHVLHNFKGQSIDGAAPRAGVVIGPNGVLYGTTLMGGKQNCLTGCGTVYALVPPAAGSSGHWTEKIIHAFDFSVGDGYAPTANLVFGPNGSLYGTTLYGGAANVGVVFELKPPLPGAADADWTETILYSFLGSSAHDGANPSGTLALGKGGTIYGSTSSGGLVNATCPPAGCGTVFELAPSTEGAPWKETILHNFTGEGGEGYGPSSGVIIGKDGGLYGTTCIGGSGGGTVFQLKLADTAGINWTIDTIYLFNAPNDGTCPTGGLAADTTGALYGTTENGGDQRGGTVFKLTPGTAGVWNETILHNFGGAGDGNQPMAGLVIGPAGSLYGTTYVGGLNLFCCGTVFRLRPPTTAGGRWSETMYNLTYTDGVFPYLGSLAQDKAGRLYGTASAGGSRQAGTVFEVVF